MSTKPKPPFSTGFILENPIKVFTIFMVLTNEIVLTKAKNIIFICFLNCNSFMVKNQICCGKIYYISNFFRKMLSLNNMYQHQ